MYKHIWFTQPNGAERNQEIYDWLKANCSDFFDSISIDSEKTKVTCKFENNEIFGLSSNTSVYKNQLYLFSFAQFNDVYNSDSNSAYIAGIHRIKSAILVDFNPLNNYLNNMNGSKKTPCIALIKRGSEFISVVVKHSTNDFGYKGFLSLPMWSSYTLSYRLGSNINGWGSIKQKSMDGYYKSIGNSTILAPMYCTNDTESPTEIGYWLNKTPTRDIGMLNINGKEYFSNGIFCILNE